VAPLCRDIPIKELKIILTGELLIVRRVQRGEGSVFHAKDAASDKVLAMRALGTRNVPMWTRRVRCLSKWKTAPWPPELARVFTCVSSTCPYLHRSSISCMARAALIYVGCRFPNLIQ
jgi:hypothetical protein